MEQETSTMGSESIGNEWDFHRLKKNRSAIKALLVLIAVTLVLPLSGCWASRQVVDYRLTEPTGPLVNHRVSVGDRLEVGLRDGSTKQFKVSNLDDSAIYGEHGSSIQLPDIKTLEAKSTDYDATWLTEAFVESALEGAAPLILIVAIPAYAGWLIYDIASGDIKDWPDDQLCRIKNNPDQYLNSEKDSPKEKDEMPDLDEIEREIEKRDARCDVTYLAEKRCAMKYTNGQKFSECVESAEVFERAGITRVEAWPDKTLCQTIENPGYFYNVTGTSRNDEAVQGITGSALGELERRGVDCSVRLDAERQRENSIT